MAKVLTYEIKYQKRQITNDGSGLATFFLVEEPAFLPNNNQRVTISHTDLPAGSSGIRSKLEEISSNTTTARFSEFIQDNENTSVNDGFTNLLVLKYDDVEFANNTGAGNCRGYITYEAEPTEYAVLKDIENSVIVTDVVPFDGDDGYNLIVGTTTGSTQSRSDIAPMAIVNRTDNNTIFANMFKTFGLPVSTEEKKEFEQTPLGVLTADSTGDLIVDGRTYTWTQNVNGTTVHPVTGHTGIFYGTAYQYLNVDEALIIEIPQNQYGEIIDGKSLKIQLPASGATGSTSAYTIYSAYNANTVKYESTGLDKFYSESDLMATTFGNAPDMDSDLSNYESNVVLLFSDNINPPYGNSAKSWADGWDEVINGDKVYSQNSTVSKEFFDYTEDQAVGIAYLDKGFIVITDPTIIGDMKATRASYSGHSANIIFTSGDTDNSQFLLDTGSFTGATPQVEFLSYTTEKTLNVICLASSDEFFRSTNETAKQLTGEEDAVFANLKSGSETPYPVEISAVGLYDDEGNLLAICKPDAPIQKQWFDVVTMNIKIRL